MTDSACPTLNRADKTLVITMGGTIESFYNPEEGTPYYVPQPQTADESCIPEALAKLGLDQECDVYKVAMHDSKEVTTEMLDHIIFTAAQGDYKHIVIVHGTDTMPLHARYLKRRIADYGQHEGMDQKTFVFTGAMEPLRDAAKAWREQADGWENLRRAVTDAREQPPGVYVEMGPQFESTVGPGPWEADTVKKFVEPVDSSPGTLVSHSEFQRDAPSRHAYSRF